MSCLQLALGCLSNHSENNDEQQLTTLPLWFTDIVLNAAAALSDINSIPKSFHACGLTSQAAHKSGLTFLFRYFSSGGSSTTDT